MKEINLNLTQRELQLLFDAICQQRGKVNKIIGQLAEMGLNADEAQALATELSNLSHRMSALMTD